MENGLIDSTIVRAHPCAAGAQKNGGQAEQALGRSRGGFSTKIHIHFLTFAFLLKQRSKSIITIRLGCTSEQATVNI